MSFSEWKKCEISDVLEIKYGKDHKHLKDGSIPLYGSGGIMRYVDTALYEKESILIPRKGTLSNLFYTDTPFWSVDTIFYSKIKDGENAKFLFYLLKTLNLASMNVGSAVPSLTTDILNKVKINLPSKETQERIASILSSLDDKIELNRQTNKTLETIAQALFKEMCLSKGEELPEGWIVGRLKDVLEIKYGKDHKHLGNGSIPLYGSGGIMRHVDKALYENESILIPRKGTLSNLFYINKPFWSVDTMFYSIIKKQYHGKFLFHLLQSLNLASMNVGSAVPSLTTEILNNIEINIPPQNILKEFDDLVTPIFQNIEANEDESNTLATLRDSLLPRLMKGEIEL